MSMLSLPGLHRFAPHAPVVVRVIVGAVFVAYGWQKLTVMGPAAFGSNMLGELGLPAPVVLGHLVTWLEVVGGLLLIAGLLTRVLALVFTAQLLVAMALVKSDLGFIAPADAALPGMSFDLALVAGLMAIVVLGPGRPSVDHAIGIEETAPGTGDAAAA